MAFFESLIRSDDVLDALVWRGAPVFLPNLLTLSVNKRIFKGFSRKLV